jgi:hypothetical protein
MLEYGFLENQDYSIFKNLKGENSGIGCFEKIDSLKTRIIRCSKMSKAKIVG